MASKLLNSPWRAQFNKLIALARSTLVIVAPFYSEETARFILTNTRPYVKMYFLLALSEQAVRTRAQSPAAIKRIEADPRCRVKFIENLHAKAFIADRKTAVITSSNLTNAGLDSNFEMGLLTDDPQTVSELILRIDWVWNEKAKPISDEELEHYDRIAPTRRGGSRGSSFGNVVRFGRSPRHSTPIGTPGSGWILVHSKDKYGPGKKFASPQIELAQYKAGELLDWHWNLPKRIKKGGPYTLLLAFDKKVFGKVQADVTHKIDDEMHKKGYTFAFIFRNPKRLKHEIQFSALPLGTRETRHHSLIKLNGRILATYKRLTQ